jgi:hypothetical protein
MPPWIVDLVFSALILGLTYALMSEGAWGAALMFFNALFGALIALNFYEPLAQLLATNVGFIAGFADLICLLGLFSVSVLLLRLITESLAPAMVRFPVPLYHLGRLVFAFGGAVITVAIILLGFHTAPVEKKIFGVVDHNYKPPFGFGLDHALLAFFQRNTGEVFTTYGPGGRPDPFRQFGNSGGQRQPIRLFDPRGEWLLDHYEARIGDEDLLAPEGESSGGAPASEEAGAAAPGA